MSGYYTAIIFLCVFSMVIMELCTAVSSILNTHKRHLFEVLFAIIMVCSVCEWLGLALQGADVSTRLLHIVVKAVELSLAPVFGPLTASILTEKTPSLGIRGLMTANVAVELLSGALGFIYRVDENNFYSHAEFYWLYIFFYCAGSVYMLYTVFACMRKYQYNGIIFLALIATFAFSGIIMQLVNSSLLVDWITLAITGILLYIFNSEMIQQTDAITALINRLGYENYLSNLQRNAAILIFDVDNFKYVNDTCGHVYGDRCLRIIADSLRAVYSPYGKCFRIGGDEFCVILTRKLDGIEELNRALFARLDALRSKEECIPCVSVGYAAFDPGTDSIQTAVEKADAMMYEYKQHHRNKM